MRMIHCADLHLDSKLNTYLNEEQRRERRAELLESFRRMVQYGRVLQVEAVLIAGDLFDRNVVSETAVRMVKQVVEDNPEISFYYLRGNHDDMEVFRNMEPIPDNLRLFGDTWQYYSQSGKLGPVVIAGAELNLENQDYLFDQLSLHPDNVNLVLLHGQESEHTGPDKEVRIPLRKLKNKGIDYLALGHVHTYKQGRLDARGIWCYPGCLEGRGFDECGEHGFVLLDVDEETGICETEFVPFSRRNLYTLYTDVSGCSCTEEAGTLVEQTLEEAAYDRRHMVKIVLTGDVEVGTELNLRLLKKRFEHRFFYVKLKDETGMKTDYSRYMDDETLAGEYVRIISAATEIPEDEKGILIRYGILALSGEEID